MNEKREKIKVSEEEHERRKSLGLPVTKPLRYMRRIPGGWKEYAVLDYEIIKTIEPSGMHVLALTLEGHEPRNILDAYFADMQKPSFVEDMKKTEEE